MSVANDNLNKDRDIFSEMMFGTKKKTKDDSDLPSDSFQQEEELPLIKLMNQVDEIYSSVQDLKPVFKEFSPIIDFLKKKIKQ